jgi:uncharacterized protein (TIGR02117 family)
MPNLKLALDHSGGDDAPARSRRHLLRTIACGLGLGVLLVVVLLVAAVIVTARSGDRTLWPPAAGAPTTEIHVVSHGYHAGIIIPRTSLHEQASRRGRAALGAVATRFAGFERLEIGWGDEGFYREVPTIGDLNVSLALRALLRPGNPSVLHVVGMSGDPRAAFVNSDLVRLELSAAGFDKLAEKLDASFARDPAGLLPEPLGPGLYGTSLFFRANGAFHLFNVCNHWVASLLDAAGVPTAPVLATLPPGLLLDLEWRAGVARLPKPGEI